MTGRTGWAGAIAPLAMSLVVACPAPAQAAPPAPGTYAPEPSTVSGGEGALPCQWPTVVTLAGCTGTLIHPKVVLTAAHCLLNGDPSVVRFGETTSAPARSVSVDYCEFSPDYEWPNVDGLDYGACVLVDPIDDLPIVPPVMGCETDLLTLDQPAVIAGFGISEVNGDPGTKHWATTRISSDLAPDGSIEVGDFDAAGCPGDSGGPAFLQLEDGSWRVFGIVSGGPPCTFGADTYTTMHTHMAWFEDVTGEDLTPCHDSEGNWDPTPRCQMFPLDPTVVGSWRDSCPSPVGESSQSCGDPFDAVADREPPQVEIVAPRHEAEFDEAPASFDVVVDADDGSGWGVRAVTLLVDGREVATLEQEPWIFAGTFPQGALHLQALAEDWAQNQTLSDEVIVYVDEVPPGVGESGSDSDDSSESGASEESGESEESGRGPATDGRGCQCGVHRPDTSDRPWPTWLLALLVSLPIRGRRSYTRSRHTRRRSRRWSRFDHRRPRGALPDNRSRETCPSKSLPPR